MYVPLRYVVKNILLVMFCYNHLLCCIFGNSAHFSANFVLHHIYAMFVLRGLSRVVCSGQLEGFSLF